ncbi:RHS repeat domain-containing protein [Planctopirus limnophila]|uniref:RHS repeat domain-containing protein n=1 Tax=Planctopirus limnophila TaxID=120 RepID=UPI0001A310A5|nr:RHS repeat-associated core domain-containing protein [Planctopirus limnophila]
MPPCDIVLRTNSGLFQTTEYDSTTGSGAAERYVSGIFLKQGSTGASAIDSLSAFRSRETFSASHSDPAAAQPLTEGPSNDTVLVSAAEYDIAGRPILSTQHVDSSTTRETTYSYDYRGRRLVTQGEENFCQKETYDFRGQLIRSERYDGSPTGTLLSRIETDYDPLGRPYQSRRYAVNPTTGSVGAAMVDEVWYDQSGNVLQRTPANLALTESMTYDGLGRVLTITDARDAVTTLAYNIAGHQLSLTDAEENTTTWRYDGVGRVIEEENSLGKSRFFAYNTAGHLETRTDRNGRVIQLVHDDLGRPDTELWKTGGSTVNTVSRTYDAEGRLQSISDDVSAYAYTYDLFGHIATVDNDGTDDVPHVLLTADWNRAGNRLSLAAQVESSDDFTNSYLHNALGQPTQITQQGSVGGNSVTEKRVEFGYDVLNRPHAISRFEQVSGGTSLADSAFTFDDYGRIVQLKHAQSATILAQHYYTYDADRRLSSHETLDGTSAYDYDAIAQLTAADHPTTPDEAYSYDLTGNRTNTGYITGTNNQLLEDGTYEYLYDDEGNRIRKTEVATGDYTVYSWDHRNRLTQVEHRDSLDTPQKRVAYTYDIHNQRITRKLDSTANNSWNDIRHYTFDPTTKGTTSDCVFIHDDSGDLLTRFLHGPGIDMPLAEEDDIGNIKWLLADHLGTIRDVAEHNAGTTTVTNHLTYSTFGQITGSTAGQPLPHYTFTAREYDEDTGLHWYRARWYDAEVGRFVSEDPIEFSGGDTSLLRYTRNTSTSRKDPSGLKEPYFDWTMYGIWCTGYADHYTLKTEPIKPRVKVHTPTTPQCDLNRIIRVDPNAPGRQTCFQLHEFIRLNVDHGMLTKGIPNKQYTELHFQAPLFGNNTWGIQSGEGRPPLHQLW